MHAILASFGTDGDVIPYIGLGARLRARGHRVTVAVPEGYEPLIAQEGLEFAPLISKAESDQLFLNPDFWHPIKGGLIGARWGAKLIGRQYDLLAQLAADRDAVLVASVAIFAARLVHDKLRRPLASLILQPWMIRSVIAPPILPGFTLPAGLPAVVGNAYWRTINGIGDLLTGREVNDVRRRLRLPPVRCVFDWWYSPQCVLGLFPEWYGPPQKDWLKQIRLCGFSHYGGSSKSDLPDALKDFLRSGEKPIVITFGTGMMHARDMYSACIDACRMLGKRAIALTKFPAQLPHPLPPGAMYCTFAPFQKLFPLCEAVIHHGGIGTISKAMAAGVPQLVLPIAYDQEDNARRAVGLGVAAMLPKGRRGGQDIANALSALLSARTRAQCATVAGFFGEIDGLDRAADYVEELQRLQPQGSFA
jgi:UDP:flavonoid glycosyltransferase YjiC (YdhE family)